MTRPEGEVRAAILVASALGVSQRYYLHLSDCLADASFAVLTVDYRGTGFSAPRRLRGFATDLFEWSEDLARGIDLLSSELSEARLIYLGHRISAHLMGFARNNERIARAAFVASSTWHSSDVPRLQGMGDQAMLRVILPLSNTRLRCSHSLVADKRPHSPRKPIGPWRRWCLVEPL